MSTLLPAVLGLVGTVLGAALATWTARQAAGKAASAAREEAYRHEYRAAVLRFAGQIIGYRNAEVGLWSARFSGKEDIQDAIDERNRLRAETWSAFYQLQISTNEHLTGMATLAMKTATSISQQNSREDMNRSQTQLRENVAVIVSAARTDLSGNIPDITV